MNVPFHFYNIFTMITVVHVSAPCAGLILPGAGRAAWGSTSPWVPLAPLFSPLLPTPPGTLLASCLCPASSELPSSAPPDILTEGASAHLPVPRILDGILSTSWFRGHEAQQEATVFSPEGRPGPGHTDAGSDTVMLDPSRGRRSVTEQTHVKGEWGPKAGPIRTPSVPAVTCSLTTPLQQNLKIVTISLAHDSSGQSWSHSCVSQGVPGP